MIALPYLPALCVRVKTTPPPAGAPAKEVAISGASVMIGVGDIADCSSPGDEQTAVLVDSILKADSAVKVDDAVFTLGDNAYPVGSVQNFNQCFTPSWGDPNKRIMKKIHPAPGNHEHESESAAPYYLYFGERAGDSKKGYYAYDIGLWRAIVLNSSLIVEPQFTAADRKAQEDWLAADFKDHAKKCTVVMFHHPRFSSGFHGDDPRLEPLWQILYDANVDLVLNGHDHDYERFLPQSPVGTLDTLRGIPEIVAGTGGGTLRGFRATPTRNSVNRIEGYFGVLKLTLGAAGYSWAFIDASGRIWDPGQWKCH